MIVFINSLSKAPENDPAYNTYIKYFPYHTQLHPYFNQHKRKNKGVGKFTY